MTKILTIDDSATILKIVSEILTSNNYIALTATDGKEGLLKAYDEQPDAIILDRQMPEMDGNQVLIELKSQEHTKDIPIIMLTGDSQIADISSCLELGAVDYIVKPFDTDNLLIRLKKALRESKKA